MDHLNVLPQRQTRSRAASPTISILSASTSRETIPSVSDITLRSPNEPDINQPISNLETTGTSTSNLPTEIRGYNSTHEPKIRAIVNYSVKANQCDHHINLLQEHLQSGTAPNGLTIRIEPQVPSTDRRLAVQWEEAKLAFQSKMIEALSSYWVRHKLRISEDIAAIEDELKHNSTAEEWITIQKHISELIERRKNAINQANQRQQEGSGRGTNSRKGGTTSRPGRGRGTRRM